MTEDQKTFILEQVNKIDAKAETYLLRNMNAVSVAEQFAGIDGAHHKDWVIDNMIQYLLADKYPQFVEAYEKTYSRKWNKGIAP